MLLRPPHINFFTKNLVFTAIIFFLGIRAEAQEKKKVDLKEEIIFNNKRYRIYNNWFSMGAGPAYNTNIPRTQFAFSANYTFHINKYYFRAGTLLSGDELGRYNNVQGHLCYALRKETQKYNLTFLIGPSYTSGYEYQDSTYSQQIFYSPGIYSELQFIGKMKYDVGFGPALFVDVNYVRTIVGLRLDLYFSGAYKGEK